MRAHCGNKASPLCAGDWDTVTCAGTTCYVAGSSGRIAVSHDGAQSWQEEATPTFNRLHRG
jgi:photosystem II stability/assembly factor-like uncharacterized protein